MTDKFSSQTFNLKSIHLRRKKLGILIDKLPFGMFCRILLANLMKNISIAPAPIVIITGRRVWLVVAFSLVVFRLPVIALLTLAFVGRGRCRRRLASLFR